MSQRPVTVLGVSVSNVATATLLRDGRVIASVSEERLNRVKSWSGFPTLAVRETLRIAGLEPGDVDRMTLHGFSPWVYGLVGRNAGPHHLPWYIAVRNGMSRLMADSPQAWEAYRVVRDGVYRPVVHTRWRAALRQFASDETGIQLDRITNAEHHRCHAYAGIYTRLGRPTGKYLVFTNDGRGDDCSSAVWLYDDGKWTRLASTSNDHSLGYIFLHVTELLGMKPNEHEYKVMGLAPYASPRDAVRSLEAMRPLVWVDGMRFRSRVPSQSFYSYLRPRLERHRFDNIAAAAQALTETLLCEWTANAIRETGVHDIVLSGGTYLNVKANMLIGALPEVRSLTVCPSPSDDSSSIGAAYIAYEDECARRGVPFEPQPLDDLYLGPAYSRDEIEASVRRARERGVRFSVERPEDVEAHTAELLAAGEVVARFDGRMEFGARALGNRSLLANPSDPRVIDTLNRQIKSRDFWMPFAGTVLEERASDYLINPKAIAAPHMVITFETTPRAQRDMPAAMHPMDHTMRPQLLNEATNPKYYRTLKLFETLTGIGGVLNTSFNLHGEPIACSPDDALRTFEQSGLRHLILGALSLRKEGGPHDAPDSREMSIASGHRHNVDPEQMARAVAERR